MHRRFSSLVTKSGREGPSDDYDKESVTSSAATVKAEEIHPPSLKIKRVDHYYSKWYKSWRYRNTSAKTAIETIPVSRSGENDPWKDYSFVIVRKIPQQEHLDVTVKFVIKSPYLVKACKDVIQEWPGISWNSDPLEVDPEMFLTFLDEFIEYRDALKAKGKRNETENHVFATVNLLLSCLESDYKNTIKTIRQLKSHGEITFGLLYAILVPRTTFVARCAATGQPRLFKLIQVVRSQVDGTSCYQLACESVDLVDRPATQTVGISKVSSTILLSRFRGTVKIDSLDAYPTRYHVDEATLLSACLERGKKWMSLAGVHHKEFDGIAAMRCGDKLLRHSVKGRIMVDRALFKRFNANYRYPTPVLKPTDKRNVPQLPPQPVQFDDYGNPVPVTPVPTQGYANGTLVETSNRDEEESDALQDLTDSDILLASTVVYGFSLSDKLWLEFDVTKVTDVQWNQEAFANLVLPEDRKSLLQSLVEAHRQELGFDDFIKGKGHGLVVNLYGPPGVGKTFSAEATSEHVKRPLYLVGAGDLGTEAARLDLALERVFEVATAWKAIVLIDEADVFLEQRSLHELERNAMVAVFLRHIEYYRGILFLTTNRVKAFDEAFLSRIHVALHFHDLPMESKVQVWTAFIKKVGAEQAMSGDQIKVLAERNVNGRQIKNAVRTAQSLAVGKGERLEFKHFLQTLDAMDAFTKEFEKMK